MGIRAPMQPLCSPVSLIYDTSIKEEAQSPAVVFIRASVTWYSSKLMKAIPKTETDQKTSMAGFKHY